MSSIHVTLLLTYIPNSLKTLEVCSPNLGGDGKLLTVSIVLLIGGAAIVTSSPLVVFTLTKLSPIWSDNALTEFTEPNAISACLSKLVNSLAYN